MQTNCSLTFYSRSVSGREEVWTRSTVDHAQWENAEIAIRNSNGLLEADRVTIFVPLSEGEISVKPGDYIVRGTVSDEISALFTISALREKYRTNCAVVRSINRLDFGSASMQHWQIGAS